MQSNVLERVIEMAEDIQYLIVKSGGMATKSRVEDVLMKRLDLTRAGAHTITNMVESRNNRPFIIGKKVKWIAKRKEPDANDYEGLLT